MDNDSARSQSTAPLPMRDARQRFVQRAALWMMVLSCLAAAMAGLLHWLDPNSRALDRTTPLLLAVVFAALALRQWRWPERMVSTLWTGWLAMIIGLAVPVWLYLRWCLESGQPLVEVLPPVGPVLLCSLVVMAVFARSQDAWRATLVAWLLIAAPVLAYLLTHRQELWTPRGLELLLALGPFSLVLPLLIPLLRGLEQRFQSLHQEGERLQALAERDVLIGLYNRRAGERFLSTLLAHARDDAALILFDIDHFKRINDSHGHPAGDAVLIEVGRRCSQLLDRDDIFARWGGEEFLIVLPGMPAQESMALAERLREAIQDGPIAPAGVVSASFGVTSIRANDTLAEVIQRADDALYQAKAAGRNRVVSL